MPGATTQTPGTSGCASSTDDRSRYQQLVTAATTAAVNVLEAERSSLEAERYRQLAVDVAAAKMDVLEAEREECDAEQAALVMAARAFEAARAAREAFAAHRAFVDIVNRDYQHRTPLDDACAILMETGPQRAPHVSTMADWFRDRDVTQWGETYDKVEAACELWKARTPATRIPNDVTWSRYHELYYQATPSDADDGNVKALRRGPAAVPPLRLDAQASQLRQLVAETAGQSAELDGEHKLPRSHTTRPGWRTWREGWRRSLLSSRTRLAASAPAVHSWRPVQV